MRQTSELAISETGLKLIKAYEGYRPVDRELVTGQRIVGYGHRLYSENAKRMTKAEAEETLRLDLEPFEEMINTEVHAPLTQSQFDALCSFAFNIGPKAFLTSDTLRALNNGRPLDAANGFDIWRKSEIAGKTYVVDALMRRRTAEKALFLRTERDLPAGREDLPPVADTTISALSTEDALPVFSADDANGIVATAPHEAVDPKFRRREDGPAGPLSYTEIDTGLDEKDAIEPLEEEVVIEAVDPEAAIINLSLDDALVEDEDETVEDKTPEEPRRSPIAEAATDIVARLDALIEDAGEDDDEKDMADWPESLIQAEISESDNAADIETPVFEPPKTQAKLPKQTDKKPVLVIDELAQDDAFRMRSEGQRVRTDSAARYIQNTTPLRQAEAIEEKSGAAGLWIPVILGFLLIGAGGAAWLRGAEKLLGEWGPVLAFSGLVIGICLVLMGVYAAVRMNLVNRD